jgi:hypothetical protein
MTGDHARFSTIHHLMKIMRIISVWLGSLSLTFAEGIPVDHETGKIECSHTVITLSAEQIEETEVLGTFTLTPEQWKGLRAKSPQTPKRFENIIPITYRDCSCGMEGPYVIAVARDRMAVLHDDGEQVSAAAVRYQLFPYDGVVTLRMNERGEFHLGGSLVPYQVLLEALAAALPDAKRDEMGNLIITSRECEETYTHKRGIHVELPMGAKSTDAVYASRWKAVTTAAKKIGFSVYSAGAGEE